MISERGELLALQNSVLDRKKLPPGARSPTVADLLAPVGSFLRSKTPFWNARSSIIRGFLDLMLAPMLAKMCVLINDLFVPGPPMISDRGDLLALQNGVLEHKKVPPSARRTPFG